MEQRIFEQLWNLRLLVEGYRKLMMELFSPKPFYNRLRSFLLHFKPSTAPVTIHLAEIGAFLKTVWFMGITGPDRFEYWSLLWDVITKMPEKFPVAVTLTVYGYHFRKVAKLHLGQVSTKESPVISLDTHNKQTTFEEVRI